MTREEALQRLKAELQGAVAETFSEAPKRSGSFPTDAEFAAQGKFLRRMYAHVSGLCDRIITVAQGPEVIEEPKPLCKR